MIVLIFIAGDDPKHPAPDHLQYRMVGIPPVVVEQASELHRKTVLFVPLAKNQQPCVGGEILVHRLHADGLFRRKNKRGLSNIV